jgi:hypothetical protein
MLRRVNDALGPTSRMPGSQPASTGAIDLRFLQDRLALFGKTIFFIAVTFLCLAVAFAIAEARGFPDQGHGSQMVATAIAFLVWQLCRRQQLLSARTQWLLDGAASISLCVAVVLMGHQLAARQPWGFFAGTLAVFHITLARAILVPSTPRRTLVITACGFAPLVYVAQSLPSTAGALEPSVRWAAVIGPLTWSATGTALATLASSVIFGLRREVVKARQLGQYTLEHKIGAGGMGEVYRARHALLRRPTAIKLLAGDVSPDQVRRFEQEVQLTASLNHPNTISIYDFGRTPDGTFYYVMELLDGLTLQAVVERGGPQPPARVIHILRQVCAALREAHGAGLIHRDIKPANIFLGRLGGVPDTVKVLDFGLVKQIHGPNAVDLSNVNAIVGTPLYLSPEAITAADQQDARSDLYALGAVAYFLLTGTPPFAARTIVEICSLHLHSEPDPVSRRATQPVPDDLARIVHACLAKTPSERPADAAALAARLSACADAGAWTEADAEAWWREQPKRVQGEVEPEGGTLQIDFDARLPTRAAE